MVTILLFFAIPEEFSVGNEFQGVLLFVVLISCLLMAWGLYLTKKSSLIKEVSDEEFIAGVSTNELVSSTDDIIETDKEVNKDNA